MESPGGWPRISRAANGRTGPELALQQGSEPFHRTCLGRIARRGAEGSAARRFRAAADAGSVAGAWNLGLVHLRRGDPGGAEPWLRAAAEGGHGRAAMRLVVLALKAGDLASAERWCAPVIAHAPPELAERARLLLRALRAEMAS